MLSVLRLVYVTILQICLPISQTSPNAGNEVDSTDKLASNNEMSRYFPRFAFFIALFNLCCFYHLLYHYDRTVSYIDTVIFLLAVIGFLLRMYCYRILGKFFTFTLLTKEDHQLIEVGPYKYLLHPSYTGQLLNTFATLLFLRCYIILICLLPYVCFVLRKRMKTEEDMMYEKFKTYYGVYKAGKYRLIPFVY